MSIESGYIRKTIKLALFGVGKQVAGQKRTQPSQNVLFIPYWAEQGDFYEYDLPASSCAPKLWCIQGAMYEGNGMCRYERMAARISKPVIVACKPAITLAKKVTF